jgi:hypothetical protein
MIKAKEPTSTEVVTGPIVSNEDAYATSPWRESRPYVGFKPTTPQKDAGCLIEPKWKMREELKRQRIYVNVCTYHQYRFQERRRTGSAQQLRLNHRKTLLESSEYPRDCESCERLNSRLCCPCQTHRD